MLLGEDERVVDVLGDAASLEGEAVHAAVGQLLAVGDQVGPRGRRPANAGLREQRLVVIQRVGSRVQRDRGRRLSGRAGRADSRGYELALAADGGEVLAAPWQQGAGGLE